MNWVFLELIWNFENGMNFSSDKNEEIFFIGDEILSDENFVRHCFIR